MTQPTTQPTTDCCEPTTHGGLGRRAFLRGMTVAGATAAVTAVHGTAFTSTAYAAAPVDRVVVLLSMRGACDGLSLVVPHADPAYYAARPSIAVPSDRLLAKDGFFGLHPALAPLLPWWNAGSLAAVHAAGLPAPNRSHFSAMEDLEDADPGSSARVGWLNRLVGRNGTGSPIEAIQYGGGVPITALAGPEPTLAAADPDSVSLSGYWDAASEERRRASLERLWADVTGPLGAGARNAFDVVDEFGPVREGGGPANGAAYPSGSDLGAALRSAARTIRADVGAEVIAVDHGSWDHHTWIGQPDDGNLRRMADEFALSVAAFFTDLGPALTSKVTLVTVSEFGRRVKENANQGLDHGYGNVMFLMGAGVKGGSYYGTWPGLANTTDADLLVTTDYRSVLSEVVTKRLGASSAVVFPGFTPAPVGVLLST